jgi:hypothetical protein
MSPNLPDFQKNPRNFKVLFVQIGLVAYEMLDNQATKQESIVQLFYVIHYTVLLLRPEAGTETETAFL